MRTWARATLWTVAVLAVAFGVLTATGAYFVFRGMDKRMSGEREAMQAIDAIRARFGERAPLIEIVDPARGDVRINRSGQAAAAPVQTVHIINWKSEDGELMRTTVPLWLMKFSTVNLLSRLGIAPQRFRLTVADVERYGPGIIVDYRSPQASRLLMWVD